MAKGSTASLPESDPQTPLFSSEDSKFIARLPSPLQNSPLSPSQGCQAYCFAPLPSHGTFIRWSRICQNQLLEVVQELS